jgi:Ran GTPase-activating protein (RanGAP) involved in mRNA processing and transport
VLDLSDNNIGMEGAKALTVVLATNSGLKYINLSNNCICGVQVQYITSTIVHH